MGLARGTLENIIENHLPLGAQFPTEWISVPGSLYTAYFVQNPRTCYMGHWATRISRFGGPRRGPISILAWILGRLREVGQMPGLGGL